MRTLKAAGAKNIASREDYPSPKHLGTNDAVFLTAGLPTITLIHQNLAPRGPVITRHYMKFAHI